MFVRDKHRECQEHQKKGLLMSDELQKRIGALEARVNDAATVIKELKEEKADLKARLSTTKDELAKTKKELESATSPDNVKQYTDEIDKLKKEAANKDKEITKLNGELTGLKDTVDRGQIESMVSKELGDYKFRNAFEQKGFEREIYEKVEGKFLSPEELKKRVASFLEAAKPPVEPKKPDTPPSDNTPTAPTDKKALAEELLVILKKGALTAEDRKKIKDLESQIEA